jgi:hypothetical protein
MAINIISADQPLQVNAIITYIYADPGLGKTSMGLLLIKQFHSTLTKVHIVLVNYVAVLLFQFKNGLILQT